MRDFAIMPSFLFGFVKNVIVLSLQHGEIQAFYPVLPSAKSMTKAFCWLFLWNFREKSINHFLGHSLSSFPVGGLHSWGILLVVPLEFQKIRHQPFPMTHSLYFYNLGRVVNFI